jgi:hypothetical protein
MFVFTEGIVGALLSRRVLAGLILEVREIMFTFVSGTLSIVLLMVWKSVFRFMLAKLLRLRLELIGLFIHIFIFTFILSGTKSCCCINMDAGTGEG